MTMTVATWNQGVEAKSSGAGSPEVMAIKEKTVIRKNAHMARKGMVIKPPQLIQGVVHGIPSWQAVGAAKILVFSRR
jgi:hypothetical protein